MYRLCLSSTTESSALPTIPIRTVVTYTACVFGLRCVEVVFSKESAAKIAGIAIGLLQSPLSKRTARWFSQDRTGLLLMPWLEGLRRLRAPSKGAPLPREVMAHGQNMM